MTPVEFKEALRSYRREEIYSVVLFILGIIGFGIPATAIADHIDKVGVDRWTILFFVIGVPVAAAILFYVMARRPQKRMHCLGLLCPTCQKNLVGFSAQVVVATGKCGHCGARYFEV